MAYPLGVSSSLHYLEPLDSLGGSWYARRRSFFAIRREVTPMAVSPWLTGWLERNRRHRTIDDGQTFVCPHGDHHAIRTVRYDSRKRWIHCPFCKRPLGTPQPVEGDKVDSANRQWVA